MELKYTLLIIVGLCLVMMIPGLIMMGVEARKPKHDQRRGVMIAGIAFAFGALAIMLLGIAISLILVMSS